MTHIFVAPFFFFIFMMIDSLEIDIDVPEGKRIIIMIGFDLLSITYKLASHIIP